MTTVQRYSTVRFKPYDTGPCVPAPPVFYRLKNTVGTGKFTGTSPTELFVVLTGPSQTWPYFWLAHGAIGLVSQNNP